MGTAGSAAASVAMLVRTLSILIVDDQPEAARRLQRGLRAIGHRATVAIDPRDAFELFQDQMFDGVITDVDMPALDGVELARQIRALRPGIPIAFCTGSPHAAGDLDDAAASGTVLGKDWRPSDLAALVRRMVALAGDPEP